MTAAEPDNAAPSDDSPLSLKRLTAAFAQMLGAPKAAKEERKGPPRDPCEISPESVVESVLFVGAAEGVTRSADELANAMRDVTPEEVDHAVERLNQAYEQDKAAYRITGDSAGYQLELLPELHRVRDGFYGRVKETKLSSAAMEVLAIVAYKQPVDLSRINQMRGGRNGSLTALLVRRGLIRLDRPEESRRDGVYHTTDRFLRVFGLDSAGHLPRVAEIDD